MINTLADASEYLKNSTIESIFARGGENDDFSKFIDRVDDAGQSLVDDMDDEDYKAAISIICSASISEIMDSGEINGKEFAFLLSQKFVKIASVVFRVSLGIAANEELR